jgi:hypothetical protein
MWIRNKGTKAKPRFFLVESRYMRGISPRQNIVCYLGEHDNFEDAIRLWDLVLLDYQKTFRKNPRWRKTPKEYPILMKYAKHLGIAEIKERLKKLRKSEARLSALREKLLVRKTRKRLCSGS